MATQHRVRPALTFTSPT
jgi:Rps23 Pro-64 3,4-dihydroxylase Tpa1-like proline 4-hydroxylase